MGKPVVCIVSDDRPMNTLIGDIAWEGASEAYITAIINSGGVPIVAPVSNKDVCLDVVKIADAILLTGGGDVDPYLYSNKKDDSVYGVSQNRDTSEIAVINYALNKHIPLLAICRGMHLVNVALNGTLIQNLPLSSHMDLKDFAEARHKINLVKNDISIELFGDEKYIYVNSLHHQALDMLGRGVKVIALSDDEVVEAICIEGNSNFLGVQWHPEFLFKNICHRRIFDWLISKIKMVD